MNVTCKTGKHGPTIGNICCCLCDIEEEKQDDENPDHSSVAKPLAVEIRRACRSVCSRYFHTKTDRTYEGSQITPDLQEGESVNTVSPKLHAVGEQASLALARSTPDGRLCFTGCLRTPLPGIPGGHRHQ